MGNAVKFLCLNELELRETAETLRHDAADDDIASGLFLKLMEYTLEKDENLASIAKGIPQNTKYTSKDIHNEIIETLAVLGEIRKRYENADSAGFCLKSDGTRDRRNGENVSVMIRFVSNSMLGEHLIGLLDLHQSEYITSEILTHLSDAGYSADYILSPCYDGASVMSGVRGVVQALPCRVNHVQNDFLTSLVQSTSFFSITMCLRNMMHLILNCGPYKL